jgi:hypothetical protein
MKGIQLDNFDLQVNVRTLDDGKKQGLEIGDVLAQNQAILLSVRPGEIKESPTMGIGIDDMLNDDDLILWRTKIRENLEEDNQEVNKITISSTGITIDAKYKD